MATRLRRDIDIRASGRLGEILEPTRVVSLDGDGNDGRDTRAIGKGRERDVLRAVVDVAIKIRRLQTAVRGRAFVFG